MTLFLGYANILVLHFNTTILSLFDSCTPLTHGRRNVCKVVHAYLSSGGPRLGRGRSRVGMETGVRDAEGVEVRDAKLLSRDTESVEGWGIERGFAIPN